MQSIITFWQMAALVETPSLADPFEAKLSKPVAELAEATGGSPSRCEALRSLVPEPVAEPLESTGHPYVVRRLKSICRGPWTVDRRLKSTCRGLWSVDRRLKRDIVIPVITRDRLQIRNLKLIRRTIRAHKFHFPRLHIRIPA